MALSQQQIVAELVERGLSPAVAQGIAMNIQDESGGDPGINEQNPTVPGSRGGFGMIQWTGPRRDELEAYAAAQGTSVDDPEMQFDNLMRELQTSESGTMEALQGVDDPGQAAAIFAEEFLRPAEEHLRRRQAKYTGGDYSSAPVTRTTAGLGEPAAGLQEPVDPDWEAPTETGLGGLAARRRYTNPNTGEKGVVYGDNFFGKSAQKADVWRDDMRTRFGLGPADPGMGNFLTQMGMQMMAG